MTTASLDRVTTEAEGASSADVRLAAWSGIAFVVLLYTGVTVGDVGLFGNIEPSWKDAGAGAAASYFLTARSALLIKCYITALCALALLPFLGHLRHRLRRSGGGAVAADGAALAGLLGAAFYMGVAAFEGVGAFRAPVGGLEARLLLDLATASFSMTWFAFGGMGLAVAVATFQTGALPRWLGWTALVFGLVYLAGPIALPSELGVAGAFGLAVWVVGVAIIWLRRGSAAPLSSVVP